MICDLVMAAQDSLSDIDVVSLQTLWLDHDYSFECLPVDSSNFLRHYGYFLVL